MKKAFVLILGSILLYVISACQPAAKEPSASFAAFDRKPVRAAVHRLLDEHHPQDPFPDPERNPEAATP